jgi:hypothetical protein
MEVVIRIDRSDGMAHICSTWPAYSRRLEKRYGNPAKYTEREGKVTSASWAIPKGRITIRRPVGH